MSSEYSNDFHDHVEEDSDVKMESSEDSQPDYSFDFHDTGVEEFTAGISIDIEESFESGGINENSDPQHDAKSSTMEHSDPDVSACSTSPPVHSQALIVSGHELIQKCVQGI